jgi:hypothetical protein
MHRVQRVQKLSEVPLPADYFDLICGTSTGGYVSKSVNCDIYSMLSALQAHSSSARASSALSARGH